MVKIDWVKDRLRKLCGQTGIVFSGGEPMLQAKACKEIADWARKELSWNILSFSGFTYKNIKYQREWAELDMWEFTKSLDILIDGPFILPERDLTLKFRGSRNQRMFYLKTAKSPRLNRLRFIAFFVKEHFLRTLSRPNGRQLPLRKGAITAPHVFSCKFGRQLPLRKGAITCTITSFALDGRQFPL